MTRYIGLMSGTSMDGIDAALVDMPSNRLVLGITTKYSDDLQARLKSFLAGENITLASICQLNTLIGREFAQAVKTLLQQAKLNPTDIKAIGSHGQTVCHDTSAEIPYTLQLGCAHTIASLTGIKVVADFRTRDLVNGGQGAPFAPLYHQELFGQTQDTVAVVNIGGISNVTYLSAGQATKGWDVGPGNCLLDGWITLQQNKSFDASGEWAAQGEVINPLLAQLLADPFVALAPPKSIGKEYYSLQWLAPFLKPEYRPVDVQATLTAFTAQTIANSVSHHGNVSKLYLCGGGTHNKHLHTLISHLLPGVAVMSTAEQGVSPDFLEAMLFAWLAAQTINEIPVNLSSITGSKGPQVLGAIYPI